MLFRSLAFGWPSLFLFMALFGFSLAAWIAARLPETAPKPEGDTTRRLDLGRTVTSLRVIVSERRSLFYALATAVFFGSLFGFLNSAPQIYLTLYGVGAWFPVLFAAGAVFVAIASLANSRLVLRFGMQRLSHGALIAYIAVAALMSVWVVAAGGVLPLWALVGGLCVMQGCFGFIATNFNAMQMEPMGAHAGMASAFFGFLHMAIGGLIGATIGQFYDGSLMPMMLGFTVCGAVALALVLLAERGRLMGDA